MNDHNRLAPQSPDQVARIVEKFDTRRGGVTDRKRLRPTSPATVLWTRVAATKRARLRCQRSGVIIVGAGIVGPRAAAACAALGRRLIVLEASAGSAVAPGPTIRPSRRCSGSTWAGLVHNVEHNPSCSDCASRRRFSASLRRVRRSRLSSATGLRRLAERTVYGDASLHDEAMADRILATEGDVPSS